MMGCRRVTNLAAGSRVDGQPTELIFPYKPWRDGAVFHGFVSNLAADGFPFEQFTVPTLVVNAPDDHLDSVPVRHRGGDVCRARRL
jgi:hypothetical protein